METILILNLPKTSENFRNKTFKKHFIVSRIEDMCEYSKDFCEIKYNGEWFLVNHSVSEIIQEIEAHVEDLTI